MLNAICGFVRFFTGVQVRWFGTEPKAVQRIYFANHTSHFDCLVLLAVLPHKIRNLVRPAGAADYWTATPIRNWFSKNVVHVIPIERSKLTKTNHPIKQLLTALDEGSSLIIFPEGGRNSKVELQEFKCGLYHLSKKRPDVELVPTYIENANRILPKGEFIPIPMLCSITFGEPIRLLPNEGREEFLLRAKQAVERCAS
jgi:1-acyl-sn-glycerol-3-phosphate acyltransferase